MSISIIYALLRYHQQKYVKHEKQDKGTGKKGKPTGNGKELINAEFSAKVKKIWAEVHMTAKEVFTKDPAAVEALLATNGLKFNEGKVSTTTKDPICALGMFLGAASCEKNSNCARAPSHKTPGLCEQIKSISTVAKAASPPPAAE